MPGFKRKKKQEEEQPPPPQYNGTDNGKDPGKHGNKNHDNDGHKDGEKCGKSHWHFHKHHEPMDALERIYFNLMEMRREVDKLAEERKQEKIRRRMEVVPVRISDLMQGFQAAVARANRSTLAGDGEGEDIAPMSVKDLEISLSAPIIEGGHAADPVVMLPNIKSVDTESAKISLKFSIVSVPLKKRG